MSGEQCGNCQFWIALENLDPKLLLGFCRITHISENKGGDEWCGEWESNPVLLSDENL
ncbi:unnamed protein product, partial [marine sediment metagenome]